MQERIDLAKYRLKMAEETYEVAIVNISSNHYLSANNRIYYCIFHCMRAVLALDKLDYKKHSAVISNFVRMYLKTGIFDKSWGNWIVQLQEIRNNSDYNDFYIVSKPQTVEFLDKAKHFLEDVRTYVLKRCESIASH